MKIHAWAQMRPPLYVFKQTHGDGVGNQKYCRNETVLLGTQNIKPWLQIELTRLQNFVKV